MRHAAEWGDVWYPPLLPDLPTLEKRMAEFWRIVDEVGRDPETLSIVLASLPGDPHLLDRVREQGIESVTLFLLPQEPDEQRRELERFATLLPQYS